MSTLELRSKVVFGLLAVCGVASAAPVVAAPTLTVTAEQHQTPAKVNLSPIQLWDTDWWVVVEAQPDGAPLSRIEMRTRFRDENPQSNTGGVELHSTETEPVAGRIAIRLPMRTDYERRLEARVRVYDAAGEESDWALVEFPPEKTTRPQDPEKYVVRVDAGKGDYRLLGTVRYEATESSRLSAVRDDIERQAKEKGGDAAINLRLVRASADTFVFAADVIRYVQQPAPTATTPPARTDVVLGEIVIPYERK